MKALRRSAVMILLTTFWPCEHRARLAGTLLHLQSPGPRGHLGRLLRGQGGCAKALGAQNVSPGAKNLSCSDTTALWGDEVSRNQLVRGRRNGRSN